ncbi:MFS transporter [Streptomyces kanasensis]|uniref:MFS transporter n=1 Tax=Streptomyces kanasensis TaxID=936756 RepID=UPI0036F767F7
MRRNKPIIMLSVGHACVDVYQGAVASLVPYFVTEHAYGYAAASGVVLAASVLSSVAQPLFGLLTDRWAMPWLLPVATLLAGAGVALAGVGGSYAHTLLFVAVSGLGVAAYHPESARVARLAAGDSHRAMAWFSLGGNVGFALAPLLVAAVVAVGGLRMSPLLAVPALVGGVLCLPAIRAVRKADRARPGAAVPAGPDRPGPFLRLSLAVVCRSVVFVGLSTFVPLLARQRTGGDAAVGTAALFVLFLGGAVGSVLGGALAERWDRVTVCRWSYLATAVAVAGIVTVPGPALLLCVALASVGLYVPFSLQVTLGQDYLPSRVGTAAGITLGLTVSVGGLTAPLVGALADATSLATALSPLVLLPLAAALLFATLPEPAPPRRGATAPGVGDPVEPHTPADSPAPEAPEAPKVVVAPETAEALQAPGDRPARE